jgi:hypothetical protein
VGSGFRTESVEYRSPKSEVVVKSRFEVKCAIFAINTIDIEYLRLVKVGECSGGKIE